MANEIKIEAKSVNTQTLLYDVDQWPPVWISISVACQHLICCAAVAVTVTYAISDVVCISNNDPIRSKIFCSSMFMVGIATIVQSLVGVRLPVLQGSSLAFIPPVLFMKTSGIWQCFPPKKGMNGSVYQNTTTVADSVYEQTKYDRISEVQGSLMVASLLQVFTGATGLIGFLLRFIGPITVSVTIFLLGINLYPVPILYSQSYWPVAITCTLLMIIFGVYLSDVKISLPRCFRRKGSKKKQYSIFDTFAVVFSIAFSWILCWLLTNSGVFPEDSSDPAYWARTDTRVSLIEDTPWFFFPYPGQFGLPTFRFALFIGILPVILLSTFESIGDYFTLSLACKAYPLPPHAVNRGILIEGIMSILSASLGTGHATTSYSNVAPIIAVTKVGSRYVMAVAGAFGVVLAIFGKLGAVLTSMPNPVIGGYILFILGIGMSLGISGLRHVDMTSTRNISVVGLSICLPIIGSEWLNRYPGIIKTGSEEMDNTIEIILRSPMLVGGIVAFVLDNTVKGTREERGFKQEITDLTTDSHEYSAVVGSTRSYLYDVPYVDKLSGPLKLLRSLPFIQKFDTIRADHSV